VLIGFAVNSDPVVARKNFSTAALVVHATIALGFLVGGSPVLGQDAVDKGVSWPHLTGYAEVAVADKYIYHGYIVQDKGPVVQPYVEIFGEFYRGEAPLTSASLRLSIFNSFQVHDESAPTKAEPLRSWYETQIEPGLELIFAKHLTLIMSYRRFESPNAAYSASNSFELRASFDDESLLGRWAIHPHVAWSAAFDNGSADGERGNYFEAGIAPQTIIGNEWRYPITATVPINIGLGDQRYYFGSHFGFFSAGVKMTVPLAFLPPSFGRWRAGGSAELYYLGSAPANFTNGGDRLTNLVTGIVSTEF
jgi:hypothetical protein